MVDDAERMVGWWVGELVSWSDERNRLEECICVHCRHYLHYQSIKQTVTGKRGKSGSRNIRAVPFCHSLFTVPCLTRLSLVCFTRVRWAPLLLSALSFFFFPPFPFPFLLSLLLFFLLLLPSSAWPLVTCVHSPVTAYCLLLTLHCSLLTVTG